MKFLMLVCVDGAGYEAEEESDSEESRSFPWLDDVMARGIRLDGDRLRPPREAKTVLVRNDEVLVSDGPFAETKEVICGFDILECASIDEAVEVAAAHPVARFGRIEVRAFWPGKLPGKAIDPVRAVTSLLEQLPGLYGGRAARRCPAAPASSERGAVRPVRGTPLPQLAPSTCSLNLLAQLAGPTCWPNLLAQPSGRPTAAVARMS
jgi:hypothetical protein